MMSPLDPRASRSTARLIDAVLVVWLAGWLVAGIFVAIDIHHLGKVAATVGTAGHALRLTAQGLKSFAALPFVGHQLAGVGAQVAAAGRQAQQAAIATEGSVNQLSWLLGMCVVVIPGVPALAVYLPFRVARARESRAVRRALGNEPDRAAVNQYLANRALATLPYHVLRQVSDEPWEEVRAGRYERLAAAELARLGVRVDRGL
ncbi:MAG: hypothetical protein ACRDYD_07670 [Acidimicrobiales bacterium]